jgi:hypothetical protein
LGALALGVLVIGGLALRGFTGGVKPTAGMGDGSVRPSPANQFMKMDAGSQFNKATTGGQFPKVDAGNEFNKATTGGQFPKIDNQGGASEHFLKYENNGNAASQFPKVDAANQFPKVENAGNAGEHFLKYKNPGDAANQLQKGNSFDQFQKGIDSFDGPNTPAGPG